MPYDGIPYSVLDTRYLNEADNLSDLDNVATARTNLGLIAGGAGDIWVEKAGDTMTGALFIDGSADAMQLRVQGTAGQTANLQNWENSAGNTVLSILSDGDIKTDRWLAQDSNTFLGVDAGGAGNLAHTAGSEGYENTAIGYRTLEAVTTGYWNVCIGTSAGRRITTGYANVCLGRNAGVNLTIGYSNFACGHASLQAAVDGIENTALGNTSGLNLTSGDYNTLIGSAAGSSLTTTDYNVCVGYAAGQLGVMNDYNAILGSFAGQRVTGRYNTFLGSLAGTACTSADNNVYIGMAAARTATTGDYNVVIGDEAGRNMAAGANNVYIGRNAGFNATGSSSVFVGYQAGYNEANSNRLYISNSNTATPLIYGEFDNGLVKIYEENTDTNVVHHLLYLVHNSSNVPAANFGTGLTFQGESSTTASQDMAKLEALWDVANHAARSAALQILISNAGGDVTSAKFDDDTTAGNTRFLVYDVDNAAVERVSVGAADSGGAGFKVLRIPN